MNYMNTNRNASAGIGFLDLLTLVFIVLKLCGVIKWSWVWVLSPIWISLVVVAVLALLLTRKV